MWKNSEDLTSWGCSAGPSTMSVLRAVSKWRSSVREGVKILLSTHPSTHGGAHKCAMSGVDVLSAPWMT